MIDSARPTPAARLVQRCAQEAPRRVPGLTRGATLVEVIGVLSIIAILGAVVTPAVSQRMRQAEQEAEANTMASIAKALEKTIFERKTLPGTNDWVDWIALELDQPFERLANNRSGHPRRLLYHPGSALIPGGVGRTQTASGFPNVSPGVDRILIVSTLGKAFPAGLDLRAEETFEAFWNTEPHEVPEGWPAEGGQDPDDLRIARLDLGELLHRVVINNLSVSNTAASISVEENATIVSISRGNPGQAWQRSFIDGTGLNLLGLQGAIWSCELINEDRTFYWTDAGWGLLTPPERPAWYAARIALVTDFLNTSFPEALNQQRPRAAIDELYRSMWTYMDWAEAGFLEGGNNKSAAPDAYVMRATVSRLNEGTLNLIGIGGGVAVTP